jgi:VanZ family protein
MTLTTTNVKTLSKAWIPVVIWFTFVFVMSTAGFSDGHTYSVIGSAIHKLFPDLSHHHILIIHKIIRKLAHIFEYFVLGLLLLNAFKNGKQKVWTWKLSFFALLGVLLWAIGDEFHQLFVPVRQASIRDVAIDTTGGALAQVVSAIWYRYIVR